MQFRLLFSFIFAFCFVHFLSALINGLFLSRSSFVLSLCVLLMGLPPHSTQSALQPDCDMCTQIWSVKLILVLIPVYQFVFFTFLSIVCWTLVYQLFNNIHFYFSFRCFCLCWSTFSPNLD